MFRWIRRNCQNCKLQEILTDYPIFVRPYPGPPGERTPAELNANIAHLNDVADERITTVINALACLDVKIQPYDADDLLANAKLLQEVLWQQMLIMRGKRPARNRKQEFFAPGYSGDNAIYSLLQDLAILTHAAALDRHGHSIYWGVVNDLLDDDERSNDGLNAVDMAEYNAIVLRGIKSIEYGFETYVNIEAYYFFVVYQAWAMPQPLWIAELFQDFLDNMLIRSTAWK